MKIFVELNLFLQEYLPKDSTNPFELEIKNNSTYKAILLILGIPMDLHPLILVNEKIVAEDYILREQDRVSFFPPLGGG